MEMEWRWQADGGLLKAGFNTSCTFTATSAGFCARGNFTLNSTVPEKAFVPGWLSNTKDLPAAEQNVLVAFAVPQLLGIVVLNRSKHLLE